MKVTLAVFRGSKGLILFYEAFSMNLYVVNIEADGRCTFESSYEE